MPENSTMRPTTWRSCTGAPAGAAQEAASAPLPVVSSPRTRAQVPVAPQKELIGAKNAKQQDTSPKHFAKTVQWPMRLHHEPRKRDPLGYTLFRPEPSTTQTPQGILPPDDSRLPLQRILMLEVLRMVNNRGTQAERPQTMSPIACESTINSGPCQGIVLQKSRRCPPGNHVTLRSKVRPPQSPQPVTSWKIKCRYEWPVRTGVKKDDVKLVGHGLKQSQNRRQFPGWYGVILQHSHDFRAILHHVLEHLALADPVGHGTHLDIDAIATGSIPVHQCSTLIREFHAINRAVEVKVQSQRSQMR